MFWKILFKLFIKNKEKKILALFSLILGIGISISFFSTSIQMTDKIHREFHRFGANIKIRPKPENKKADLTPADFAELKKIFWKNQIIAATPVAHLPGTLQQQPVILNGVFITESFPISENKTWKTGLKTLCNYWNIKG